MNLRASFAALLAVPLAPLAQAGDRDHDGLDDMVETNTGVYVDETDTGTDPRNADSDGDGAGDWYEVTATFTSPVDPDDNPGVPYPLPAYDGAPGVTDKPVKVYIMAGDSAMSGWGRVSGTSAGTLDTMVRGQNKFPNLFNRQGWVTRNDVLIHSFATNASNVTKGPLSPTWAGGLFGPELGFGHVMGWYHDEPVLLIRPANENRALGWDLLPPGSPQFDWTDGRTYAGYGESPERWVTGTYPSPIRWYAGKEFDDYFLDEADMGPALGWGVNISYSIKMPIRHNGIYYICREPHTSSYASEPGVGRSWERFWLVYSVTNTVDFLDNFAAQYRQWAGQGFEIAGYVWWQGFRDQGPDAHVAKYEENLARLINQIRQYYATRYPGRASPDAPFVVATLSVYGWAHTGAALQIANAQLAVDGASGNHPEFAGNVKTVEARGYWRSADQSPGNSARRYNYNAETYMLAGDALGRAMIELIDSRIGPPVIVTAQADPATLWPPNRKMVEVQVSAVVEGGSGELALEIVKIECNEPHSPMDYQILDGHTVALRATREGSGPGRTYTLYLRVTDERGFESELATTTVLVPHDRGNRSQGRGKKK